MSLSGVELSGTSFFFCFFFFLLARLRLEGNTEKKKFPLLTKKKKYCRRALVAGLWVQDTRGIFHPRPRRAVRARQSPRSSPAAPARGGIPRLASASRPASAAGRSSPPRGTAVKAKGGAGSASNAQPKATHLPRQPARRHGLTQPFPPTSPFPRQHGSVLLLLSVLVIHTSPRLAHSPPCQVAWLWVSTSQGR